MDWLAKDDVRNIWVLAYDPEGNPMKFGVSRGPLAYQQNPYSQAQHDRGGGQAEDVARFNKEMFDPTFSQRSGQPGSSSTTNNNTAEVHFNISFGGPCSS